MAGDFDPYVQLQALDRHGVTYVIVGGVRRVIHGSDELTAGLDIVPSTKDENLRRLDLALRDVNARRSDGSPPVVDADFSVLELETDAGELKIVREPAGTRGYDDLRRRASREPLGRGLRPRVASLDDHARMLAAARSRARPGSARGDTPPHRARSRAPPRPRPAHRTLNDGAGRPMRVQQLPAWITSGHRCTMVQIRPSIGVRCMDVAPAT